MSDEEESAINPQLLLALTKKSVTKPAPEGDKDKSEAGKDKAEKPKKKQQKKKDPSKSGLKGSTPVLTFLSVTESNQPIPIRTSGIIELVASAVDKAIDSVRFTNDMNEINMMRVSFLKLTLGQIQCQMRASVKNGDIVFVGHGTNWSGSGYFEGGRYIDARYDLQTVELLARNLSPLVKFITSIGNVQLPKPVNTLAYPIAPIDVKDFELHTPAEREELAKSFISPASYMNLDQLPDLPHWAIGIYNGQIGVDLEAVRRIIDQHDIRRIQSLCNALKSKGKGYVQEYIPHSAGNESQLVSVRTQGDYADIWSHTNIKETSLHLGAMYGFGRFEFNVGVRNDNFKRMQAHCAIRTIVAATERLLNAPLE